jgi:HlyD family secretion protein
MKSALARRVTVVLACIAAGTGCRRGNVQSVAMGTVEVVEVDVAPMVPARVTKVWVREGETVQAGDTLVTLTQTTLAPDIEGRRARVAGMEARLRDLQAGARPAQLERAEAELRVAEAEAVRTASDVVRFTPLAAEGNISAQQFETVRTAAATAAARRDAARESVRLLREGARPNEIRAAQAEVESARASLAAALQTASDLTLVAANAGTITGRHVEPGEILATGEPAVTIGNVGTPWARVYIDQRLLPRVALGDSVTAVLDAFPERRFAGRIVALNDRAEFTPRVALTEDERADLLFGVKVDLVDNDGMLKAGLPVTVRFYPRAQGGPAPVPGALGDTALRRSGTP